MALYHEYIHVKWLNLICDKVTVKSVKKVVIDRHKKKENERKQEAGSSPTISNWLGMAAYSQMLSHYCLMRELLPAVFPP